jgi:Zn ribbon nucleic-acid-binding protein
VTSQEKPFNVTCSACGHRWAIAYMPIALNKLLDITKDASCPACKAKDGIKVALGGDGG